jgi:hypothetical protein
MPETLISSSSTASTFFDHGPVLVRNVYRNRSASSVVMRVEPHTYESATHISPYSQGQTVQSGRHVVKSAGMYVARKVGRDQSVDSRWHDQGLFRHPVTQRPVMGRTWEQAMTACAY